MRRCAEKMVLGEANISTAGGSDLEHANNIAREMVYRCGFRCAARPLRVLKNDSTPVRCW